LARSRQHSAAGAALPPTPDWTTAQRTSVVPPVRLQAVVRLGLAWAMGFGLLLAYVVGHG
jgi:hypothetical protein